MRELFLLIFVAQLWTSELRIHSSMPPIHLDDIAAIVNQAEEDMNERFHDIYERGVEQIPGSPAWYMAISHIMKSTSENITLSALIAEEATRYMAEEFKLTHFQISEGLSEMNIAFTNIGKECPIKTDLPCQPRKYRAFSGYCNNVQNPLWGSAFKAYRRLLPTDYYDGISLPRGGGYGEDALLPSPREVSLTVHNDTDLPHKHLMTIAAIWGEFIVHDISHTPQMAGKNGMRLKCCSVKFDDFHPECFPILLPVDDPIYSTRKERCQEFVRSATAPRKDCTLGPREQINQATSFIDGSMIYGSTRPDLNKLRLKKSGKLSVQNDYAGPIMPNMNDKNDCRMTGTDKHCFLSGDIRANEHIGLATLYTLFLREHNRIADELEALNPHWIDEVLMQEARRIVIAQIQHITYNEYLPIVLGKSVIDKYSLKPELVGYYHGYDINTDPTIANSVATAALMFTTSLMPTVLSVTNGRGDKVGEQSLLASFYAPSALYEHGGMDRVLHGMIHGHARNSDAVINEAMTNEMFKDQTYTGSGLDLAAQLIQRGRDHGLPPYVEWRQYCNLSDVKTFSDLNNIMPKQVISSLQNIYKGVSDIDLFTGGLAEFSLDGAVVGPTFTCLIAEQFKNLRRGDRHWYENDIPPSAFSSEQLEEIRKTSLARIICDNGDSVQYVQLKPFLQKDDYLNAILHCSDHTIKRIDLSKWKELRPEIVIDNNLLHLALEAAKKDVAKINEMEMKSTQKIADPKSSVGAAFSFNRPKRQATEIANKSLIFQYASSRFLKSLLESDFQDQETKLSNNLNNDKIKKLISVLPNIDLSTILSFPENQECDEPAGPCDHTAKYRTITGWCNNLNRPEVGKALKPFIRLMPPAYDDGVSHPRTLSVTGERLPSARLISSRIHRDKDAPHVRYSLMVMQFAQLLDHDLTHTPVNKGHRGKGILDCSPCDSGKTVHPDCLPIEVPQGDPYFPNIINKKKKCIPVTRSLPGRLTLGHREQINQVTAYIDASFVYGSDTCEMTILRQFVDGKLNVTKMPDGRTLLPQITTHPECRSRNNICFRAGDARASEQPGLAAIQTLFLKEHNRLASALAVINPHWNDESIYQESKRILAAINQHITYSEFLPRVFGWNSVEKYGLTLESNDYYKGYNSNCDATILNEFATAAFRFGHSLLRPDFVRMNNRYEQLKPNVQLRSHFFNPDLLYKMGVVDELMLGLVGTPMETLDHFITEEVTNHLFEDSRTPFSGMDLAAINIQRGATPLLGLRIAVEYILRFHGSSITSPQFPGRDHGLPGYNTYRNYCNLSKATNFEDLLSTMTPGMASSLKQIYNHVDDVDLFSGGLAETPLNGGIVGPTFACIIGKQFRDLRSCDRFWYENNDPFTRFTSKQLKEIRQITMARLMCNNLDTIRTIQRAAFDLPDSFLNPRVPCSAIPKMDLSHWKDTHSCSVGKTNIETGKVENLSPCVQCTCTKEGVLCQSVKVNNCFALLNKYKWKNILDDSICRIQCAFLLRFPDQLNFI